MTNYKIISNNDSAHYMNEMLINFLVFSFMTVNVFNSKIKIVDKSFCRCVLLRRLFKGKIFQINFQWIFINFPLFLFIIQKKIFSITALRINDGFYQIKLIDVT